MVDKRIKESRLLRGYTQEEFADLLGVSVVQISRYETGKNLPSITALMKIAECLDVSVDYLLGISNNPEPLLDAGLTRKERDLIYALRHGDYKEAMKVMVSEG